MSNNLSFGKNKNQIQSEFVSNASGLLSHYEKFIEMKYLSVVLIWILKDELRYTHFIKWKSIFLKIKFFQWEKQLKKPVLNAGKKTIIIWEAVRSLLSSARTEGEICQLLLAKNLFQKQNQLSYLFMMPFMTS